MKAQPDLATLALPVWPTEDCSTTTLGAPCRLEALRGPCWPIAVHLALLLLTAAFLWPSRVWAQATDCVQRPSGLLAWWPGDGFATSPTGSAWPQSDDFNDGNDNAGSAWTRYDPINMAGFPPQATYSFPNGGYRIQTVPSPLPGVLGPGRAGSLLLQQQYHDFYIAVDLAGWDATLDQAFGILARVREPGLGSTDGYALTYQTAQGGLQISVVTDETRQPAQPTNISLGTIRLHPTNTYRLVFLGRGAILEGRVYLANDLSQPLETVMAADATFANGTAGLVVYDNSNRQTNATDVTFDNYVSFPSGLQTIMDLTGLDHGTLVNGATTPGLVGQALLFDGIDGGMTIPGSRFGPLDITNAALTVQAWIRRASTGQPTSLRQAIIMKSADTSTSYALGLTNGMLGLMLATTDQADFALTDTEVLPLNQWVHVAGACDGAWARLYVNGSERASTPLTGNILHSQGDVSVGNETGDPTPQCGFHGYIDELAVFNRALTQNQIAAICAAGTNGICKDIGPPRILTAPTDQFAALGSTVTLSVTVSGNPPLAFQWRQNGLNVPGATNSNLIMAAVDLTNGGAYTVVVANPLGTVASQPALLLLDLPAVPGSDFFADRAQIVGLTNAIAGTNQLATRETDEPRHAGLFSRNSVWYTWRAPATGIATFRTWGSTFDTLLAVYVGTDLATLQPWAQDDDSGGFLTSEVQFNAVIGVDYQIAVDGIAGEQGFFALSWELMPTVEELPVIDEPPQSQRVRRGESVTFSVTASGSGLTYQWIFNQLPIPGANQTNLVLTDVQNAAVGSYTVLVVNSVGRSVLSTPAILEIGTEPSEPSGYKPATWLGTGTAPLLVNVGLPASQTLCNRNAGSLPAPPDSCEEFGNSTRWVYLKASVGGILVVDTQGSETLTRLAVYRSFFGMHETVPFICGKPDPRLSPLARRASREVGAGTEYAVAVDGSAEAGGMLQLNWVLGFKPEVLTDQTNLTVPFGSTVPLGVTILAGLPVPACHWKRNGVPIPGATNATYLVDRAGPDQEGEYAVVVSNAIDMVEVTVANLSLQRPLVHLLQNTFDHEVQAWSVTGSALPWQFDPANGNPPGCLALTAGLTNEAWYWNAPTQVLAILPQAYAWSLQFDLNDAALEMPNLREAPLVLLSGGGLDLAYLEFAVPGPDATGWRTHQVPLLEVAPSSQGRWIRTQPDGSETQATRQEVIQTLSDPTSLQIRGWTVAGRQGFLDNVALLTTCPDAPRLEIIQLNPAQVVLIWPLSSLCFQLVSSHSLEARDWTAAFQVISTGCSLGMTNIVVASPSASQFFQLLRTP